MQKLWQLRIDGVFCDVHIVVKGIYIDCHKNILAASTEYFETMFESSFIENKESFCKIMLDKDDEYGFSSEVVEVVLHYIYLGCIPIETDLKMIPDVFILSHMWLLSDIQDICTNIMVKNITTHNFKEVIFFAKKFNIVYLEEAVIDFISRNLPHIYKLEEFPEIEEETFVKSLEDPLILCHDKCMWLEAIKCWAQQSDTKLFAALERVPVNYLSEDDVDTLFSDTRVNNSKPLLEMVKAKLLEKDKPVSVKYYSKEMFHCKEDVFGDTRICKEFTPGCLVQYNADKVILKDVVISMSSLEKVLLTPTANHNINGASQVVYNNEIFFSFHTRYNTDLADVLNQAIFVYSMVDKNWRKIDIPIDQLLPESAWIDIWCMSCDEHSKLATKILHLEQSILYLFIATGKRRILLSLNLESKEAEWVIKFTKEESEDLLLEASPTWRATQILKIFDEKITFFGQVLSNENMEIWSLVFDLYFDNEIVIISEALGGDSYKDCRLALVEKDSLEMAVVYSTNRYEIRQLLGKEKIICCIQLLNIMDTTTEVILYEELDVEAASIDVVNGVMYTIGAPYCTSYNLQTKVQNKLPLENGKRLDCEIKKFLTLELRFETPGFEVSYQMLYTNDVIENSIDDIVNENDS